MTKDLVVNLTVGASRDVAGPFAISLAEAFGAHVAAGAYSYEPVIPPTIMGGVPTAFVEQQPKRTTRRRMTQSPASRKPQSARACRSRPAF